MAADRISSTAAPVPAGPSPMGLRAALAWIAAALARPFHRTAPADRSVVWRQTSTRAAWCRAMLQADLNSRHAMSVARGVARGAANDPGRPPRAA